MDKKKIALIVVVLFLLIGLGSFVFANPDQDNDLEGPGVSEDGGSGDGEVIDGTEPTATPEEENDDSATETDPITTYGNGGNGTGTGAGNNGTTGGVGNTDMSQYDDARRIIEELENRVNSMQNKDDSNDAVDYRTDTDIIDMVNNLPDGTVKDELKDRLDAINKVLDDTTAPVITGINNNDVTKENVTINVTDDNDVTFTATLDGEEIEFTTPLTAEGHYVVTVTDKNFNTTTVEFTIDKTPIALDWLYVLNNSGTDYKVIGDGQKLYVELVFSEEFTSTPMIQIGNAEAVEMSCHWTNWQTEKQYFKCDATITIDGSTMGLENGKEVPVQITNVLDAAGNETVLTNENITETEKYGHVIYDKQAPKMEVLRLTNVSRKDENGAWLQVAKAGDIVRVIVQFNENLATLPTLKVNGTEVGVMKYDSNMQSYTYDYKVTENDVNGVMQIEISNYADAAGNVGDTLTNENINHDTQNQVVIDTVAPEYAAMGIFNWTNDNDGTDRTYATKGEHIRLYVSFPEMLVTNPKVDIYGMDGKVTTLDLTYSEAAKFYFVEFDTTDEFALPEGKINFKVYGYADEAGNVGVDLTQDMTTSNEYPQVIYDSIAPVLNFNNGFITDAFTVVATDDNFDYMTVQYYDGREMKTITENTFTLDAEGDNIHYNIKAYDKAGNVSAYADIYLDTQAPVLSGTGINGKNEVEVKDGGYYKNATIHFEDGSLKKVVLVNEDDTEEVLEEYENNYTTAKMVFDRTFTEDGTYTIKAIDRKGNETVVTFTIDNAVPKITVKEDYVGNLDKNVFSNLSFKLYDNTGVSAYKINDGEYKELTVNNWSDANFQNIKNALVYGKNTITLRDVAGNEAVYEFVYDNVKPGPRVVGITGFFNEAEGADAHYITTGESVRILTYYDEKLGTAPMVKIGNKEFQTYYAEQSSSEENGSYAYYADIKITEDLGLSDGEIQFSIHGHKDVAGNEGRAYTNADVTYTESSPYEIRYDKVILDNAAPEFNVTSGTHSENTMEITITDDNYNYAKIVNQDNGVSENVDEPTFTLQQEATYHIYAYDKAGNVTDLWVAIDNDSPTITIQGNVDDNENRYYNTDVTVNVFDKFLTTVTIDDVTYNRDSFTADSKNENFQFETIVSGEGEHTVTAVDKYGHRNEIIFTIDTANPVFSKVPANNEKVNDSVSPAVSDNYGVASVTLLKDGEVVEGYGLDNMYELSHDGIYTLIATDYAGNPATISFTIDKTAPTFDFSAIPDTFEVGVDSYTYPENGVVVDNFDEPRGFGNVHMLWYKLNDDGTRTAVEPFEWNTDLSNRELGKYVITYRTYDEAGNEAKDERIVTLQDTTPATIIPNRPEVSDFIQGVDTYDTETGVAYDNYDQIGFSAINIEYYLKNADGTETHVDYFAKPSSLEDEIPGVYRIHYWYRDANGNYSEVNRTFNLKNMDDINRVQSLVSTAETMLNDGTKTIEEIQHSIDVALQEANKLPEFTEKTEFLNQITNLQNILNNRKQYNKVNDYFNQLKSSWYGNESNENVQYYIDVINQQINSFTGYETERQNIINGTTEIQDALNNRKAYQNVLSYLEKAQEANRNGDDESLQTYIDIVKQQIDSFTGYETERTNILNKVNLLQDEKNNRYNYNLLLEYYNNALDSYNNGEDKQTIQYYIDVTKQQLNRVDNYETEKSNIEKSIQELQEKVNNM